MHTECFYLVLPQDFLLRSIHVSQPDVNQLLRADPLIRLQPPKYIIPFICCQTREERHWHPVNIATVARLGGVDIRMRIHPYHGHLSAQSLSYGFCCAGYSPNGY